MTELLNKFKDKAETIAKKYKNLPLPNADGFPGSYIENAEWLTAKLKELAKDLDFAFNSLADGPVSNDEIQMAKDLVTRLIAEVHRSYYQQ